MKAGANNMHNHAKHNEDARIEGKDTMQNHANQHEKNNKI
jgi:hypothetical protein